MLLEIKVMLLEIKVMLLEIEVMLLAAEVMLLHAEVMPLSRNKVTKYKVTKGHRRQMLAMLFLLIR